MKRPIMLYGLMMGLVLIWGCGLNSSSFSDVAQTGDGTAYAKYGKALNDAIPGARSELQYLYQAHEVQWQLCLVSEVERLAMNRGSCRSSEGQPKHE
jgi:hypothetical protein